MPDFCPLMWALRVGAMQSFAAAEALLRCLVAMPGFYTLMQALRYAGFCAAMALRPCSLWASALRQALSSLCQASWFMLETTHSYDNGSCADFCFSYAEL
ncbi:hypothetical protein AVEN_25439-1 [Araneus ventricosus]|uniref:Uncharacterized protein n=1 Tax=Araneus ventricosus TaxID=182803 RepID=A0A4Y2TXA2_ARAVE|nr:hypothetical protein AVEN_25439-1 [Araneus ventricosus]